MLDLLIAFAAGVVACAVVAHLAPVLGRAMARVARRVRVWWAMTAPTYAGTAARASLEREMRRRWNVLGDDERAVLVAISDRLVEGRIAYGELVIDSDPRDWRAERRAEIQDAIVYSGIADIAHARRRRRRDGPDGCRELAPRATV